MDFRIEERRREIVVLDDQKAVGQEGSRGYDPELRRFLHPRSEPEPRPEKTSGRVTELLETRISDTVGSTSCEQVQASRFVVLSSLRSQSAAHVIRQSPGSSERFHDMSEMSS